MQDCFQNFNLSKGIFLHGLLFAAHKHSGSNFGFYPAELFIEKYLEGFILNQTQSDSLNYSTFAFVQMM